MSAHRQSCGSPGKGSGSAQATQVFYGTGKIRVLFSEPRPPKLHRPGSAVVYAHYIHSAHKRILRVCHTPSLVDVKGKTNRTTTVSVITIIIIIMLWGGGGGGDPCKYIYIYIYTAYIPTYVRTYIHTYATPPSKTQLLNRIFASAERILFNFSSKCWQVQLVSQTNSQQVS